MTIDAPGIEDADLTKEYFSIRNIVLE